MFLKSLTTKETYHSHQVIFPTQKPTQIVNGYLVDAKVKQQASILSKKHGIRSSELDVDTDEELFGDD